MMESPRPKRELSEAGEREWEMKEMAEQHAKEVDAQRGLYEWEMEERLGIDHLTGLKNRRAFEGELERALKAVHSREEHNRSGGERLKEVAVIFVDLDNFKTVNDTLGHLVGDEALKKVAEILTSSIRETDVAARFGGDEFYVFLPRADERIAEGIANKICVNLRDDPKLREVGITASLGVCSVNASTATDSKTLINHADAAAYIAKNNGKDRVEVYNSV